MQNRLTVLILLVVVAALALSIGSGIAINLPVRVTSAVLDEATQEYKSVANLKFFSANYSDSMVEEVLGVSTNDTQIDGDELLEALSQEQKELSDFYDNHAEKVKQEESIYNDIIKLRSFLASYKSPIADYTHARAIVTSARAAGGDYRIAVAIMGIESGFCRAPHKKYNCFGFLNGVYYSNFLSAINDIVPRITRNYSNRFGTNFLALAKAYGMHNVDYHAPRMQIFYSKLL